jgi:hypothetical protein
MPGFSGKGWMGTIRKIEGIKKTGVTKEIMGITVVETVIKGHAQ